MSETRINWFEKNPKKTLASLIIVSFLIFDFGGAALLKAFSLFTPSYIPTQVREATYRQKHPVFHHSLKKNIDYNNAEWGGKSYHVATNSLGFKDSHVRDIPLKTETPRYLLLGDSFTEGVGIEYAKTFAGHIEMALKKKNIHVLNAAVSSYSPIIYLRKVKYLLEDQGLQFNKLVVFIDLSDIEDDALIYKHDKHGNIVDQLDKNKSDAFQAVKKDEQPRLKEFFTNNTLILGRLRNLAAWYRGVRRNRALDQRRAMWTLDEKLFSEYGRQGLENAAANMTYLKQLLDKHNIELTIAVYPWPDQIKHQDLNSKQAVFWQQWAMQNQLTFINLFPAFINDMPADDVIEKYYIRGDVHWNAQGHKLVAKKVLAYLQK